MTGPDRTRSAWWPGAGVALLAVALGGSLGCVEEQIVYVDLRPASEGARLIRDPNQAELRKQVRAGGLDCWWLPSDPNSLLRLQPARYCVEVFQRATDQTATITVSTYCVNLAAVLKTLGDLQALFQEPGALAANVPMASKTYLRLLASSRTGSQSVAEMCGITQSIVPSQGQSGPWTVSMYVLCRPEQTPENARLDSFYLSLCQGTGFLSLVK